MSNETTPVLGFSFDDDSNNYANTRPAEDSTVMATTTNDGGGLFGEHGSIIFLGVLMGVIVFLVTLLVVLVIPQLYEFLRRRAANEKKVARNRRKQVQQWIVRKVCGNERMRTKAGCRERTGSIVEAKFSQNMQLLSSPFDITQTISQQSSSKEEKSSVTIASELIEDIETGTTAGPAEPNTDDDDDDGVNTERECMICMEEFAAGDSVAWSIHCDHVFHDDCLTEWLMKHDNCPYCRQLVIPDFDGVSTKPPSKKKVKQMQADRTTRIATTSYSLEEGFVVRPSEKDKHTKHEESTSYVEGLLVVPNGDEDKDENDVEQGDDTSLHAPTDHSSEDDDTSSRE